MLVSRPERTYSPTSANQRRMFVLNRLSPDGIDYNVPVALRLQGELDVDRLHKALHALAARHDALRTSFSVVGDEVVQMIANEVQIEMDLREVDGKQGVEELNRSFVRGFDLGRAPLFRSCLARMGKTDHVLLLDLHHIVCDGVSVDVLAADLGRLYDGQDLNAPPSGYKDFVQWQAKFSRSPEAKKQEEYWLELLGEYPPALDLPLDFPRQRERSLDGRTVAVQPGEDLARALRTLAARQRVSMYMLLLSAYNILLSKYTGQEDVLVGTLAAGRPDERFMEIVGLFVNTLVLRSRPAGNIEFVDSCGGRGYHLIVVGCRRLHPRTSRGTKRGRIVAVQIVRDPYRGANQIRGRRSKGWRCAPIYQVVYWGGTRGGGCARNPSQIDLLVGRSHCGQRGWRSY